MNTLKLFSLSAYLLLTAFTITPVSAQPLDLSEKEQLIATSFYNAGRTAGYVEAWCVAEQSGIISEYKLLKFLPIYLKNDLSSKLAIWRLKGISSLNPICQQYINDK